MKGSRKNLMRKYGLSTSLSINGLTIEIFTRYLRRFGKDIIIFDRFSYMDSSFTQSVVGRLYSRYGMNANTFEKYVIPNIYEYTRSKWLCIGGEIVYQGIYVYIEDLLKEEIEVVKQLYVKRKVKESRKYESGMLMDNYITRLLKAQGLNLNKDEIPKEVLETKRTIVQAKRDLKKAS